MSIDDDIAKVDWIIPVSCEREWERVCDAARESEGLREQVRCCQGYLWHREAEALRAELAALRNSEEYRTGEAVMGMPRSMSIKHCHLIGLEPLDHEWVVQFFPDVTSRQFFNGPTPLAALEVAGIKGE